ncbi:diaminobutyrate--2-oxoglutarate transaminase [Xenorhabdus nematophila]|uniref:Diaminobutyrate--2-oxoglutarate transaminase n=2 Tax=Xenorhabdus nematophila TaxID=628 RepID=D3VGU3_XENNA|nr:diaminobutyrate--2-oxoglutarate transaminase [Xenorhabdus nematophila]CEE94694.1 Diaminobutyrate--2-oxoglutarate transaminase (Diaminobutyrate--2-oxoglutarate aminotransferase) (L-2,4-diaminobutyric acid transaminase) (DABA aminotransferase) [Xenorhabdus nematophila str. Anatoliense]CEF31720.1 Diaminobutyrate--2-oxoglutarate transaminase (Diaminobutyrate--2-oxoglutarate aminotransferase) (L-2,4-diaminobutyric acid transaminase) (DABA aminotransferase) [Xenorhabdus nematophila str. Websteri]AY
MEEIFNNYESKARSYCRTFPAIFKTGTGSIITDVDGKLYIDFLSGAGALNYGHNNENIKQQIIKYIQNDGIVMGLDLHSEAKGTFISTFVDKILKPRQLEYRLQFTSPTGTSVIESAIKLARKYTKRENIICFTNAFHGMTGVSLSLTGSQHHRQSGLYSQITRLPFDGYIEGEFDYIGYFRKLLTDPSSGIDLPAAVILETVQGEGGLNVASVEWLSALRKLTEEFNILLIVDDIQSGCGRTGTFFSFERANIKPDLICLSKSIGGNGLPMALLLISPDIDVWKPAEDNGTFRGNNLAFVASTAMLNEYWSDSSFQEIIQYKAELIRAFLSHFVEKYHEIVLSVKGIGFMQGIEMINPALTQRIVQYCFENGLIVERCGPNDEVLKLMPALTIDEVTLEKGLNIIEQALISLKSEYGNDSESQTQRVLADNNQE